MPIRGRSPLGRAGTHRSAVDNDPAFAIRVLADIAIRALSPAVNDPTTAVQSIDRIEDLLRYAAAKHLADGRVRDHRGTARLVYPTPAWDDLVALALDEIRAFGAGQYQIARRVWALLDGLLDGVPARRRPAVLAQRAARLGSLRTLNGNHADSPSASPRQDESGRGYWAVSPSRLGFTHPGGCRAVGVGIEWM